MYLCLFIFRIYLLFCVTNIMNLTVKVSHFFFYILILLKLCYFSYHCSVKSHFEPHPIITPQSFVQNNTIFGNHTTFYFQHVIFSFHTHNSSTIHMIQIHKFKTLALPTFPIFFIFNSYSHTHSNLKRASSIPKLFFFHIYFFLILSFAPIQPQYFTLFKFTSSKPCLFFTSGFFSIYNSSSITYFIYF